MTRPLIRSCMTPAENKLVNLRNNGNKRQRHPYYGAQHAKSFFPYFTKLWNDLPQEQRRTDLIEFKIKVKIKYKPPKCKFYSTGCKQGNKLLTQLRLERYFLTLTHIVLVSLNPPSATIAGLGNKTLNTSCWIAQSFVLNVNFCSDPNI